MTNQIPEYEDDSKMRDILETGIVPENLTEEEAKQLYLQLRQESMNILGLTKSLQNSLEELVVSASEATKSSNIQMEALVKTLEVINSSITEEEKQSD